MTDAKESLTYLILIGLSLGDYGSKYTPITGKSPAYNLSGAFDTLKNFKCMFVAANYHADDLSEAGKSEK